ncbi:MAG: hypothetical protein K6E87_02595 [bacterium]|nr:hypothetical protein [bacterium]
MEKKKGAKIVACSLLVGLLALTACGKKNKQKTTTKPTSNTTTEQTTEHTDKVVTGFNVYIDNQKCGVNPNDDVITFTYGDGYDYLSHIKVELVYDDSSVKEITTGYNVVTDITQDSECASSTEPGKYNLAISYGNFSAVNISLIVNQKEIDLSEVCWNIDELDYNGTEQQFLLKNVPTLPSGAEIVYTGNKKTDAGNYTARAELKNTNKNIVFVNIPTGVFDTDKAWKIEPKQIDLTGVRWDVSQFTYDGNEHQVSLKNVPTLPSGIEIVYTGNKKTDAGTYTARAGLNITDTNYVISEPAGVFDTDVTWQIVPCEVDMSKVAWDYSQALKYNGEEQTVLVKNLPTGVTATYSGNKATNPNTYLANVTFEAENSNYIVSVTSLDTLEWTIEKSSAEITNITDPSKTYDGLEVSIDFENNVSAPGVIYYKQYGTTDDQYTTDAPINAGLYTAKIVIAETINYDGCEETVDFEIFKKVIQKPNRATISEYSGSNQTFSPEGFDSEIMEFYESPDVIQQNIGLYYYKFQLKDNAQPNYAFYSDGFSNECYWYINGDLESYIEDDGIIIDDNVIDVDFFESLEYLKDVDIIKLLPKTNYVILINGNTVDEDNPYTIDGVSAVAIEIQDSSYNLVYHNEIRLYYSNLIYTVGINGDEFIFDNTPIFYNTDSDKITLDFSNANFDDLDSLIVNEIEVDLSNPVITLDIDDLEDNSILVEYYDKNDSGWSFYIYVNQDLVVSSLDVRLMDTNTGIGKCINVVNDGYGCAIGKRDSKSIYLNCYDSILLDIDVDFMAGYENCTYGLYYDYYSEDDYEECNFHNNNMSDNNRSIYLVCFNENGESIYQICLNISCNSIEFDPDLPNIKPSNGGYYISTDDGIFSAELESDNNWSQFDYYVDEQEMSTNIWTNDGNAYTDTGIYREKLQLKTTHLGQEYTKYFYVDVLYNSNDISTYANRIGLSYINFSDEDDLICNGENGVNKYIIAFDKDNGWEKSISADELIGIAKDDLYLDLKTGYNLDTDETEMTFDEENEYLIIKYVFTDSSENKYEIYTILDYYNHYSNNTNIVGEKIVGHNNLAEDDEETEFNIENDVVNITNASVLVSYKVELEDTCSYELFDSDDDSIKSGNDAEIELEFEEEGTYYLVLTAMSGNERRITINVTGDYGNLIKTSIGDGIELYLDSDFSGNLIINESGTSIKGYYGESSQDYIDDGKVEVNVSGLMAEYLYIDSELNERITTNKVLLDVHDIDTKPYIVVYMRQFGEITLYLVDQPVPSAVVSFGADEDFGFTINENGVETDAQMIYGMPIAFITTYVDSMTLTLNKAYEDYSYSIIVGDYDFAMEIMSEYGDDSYVFDYTFAELEGSNHLYRVDSNTLTVEIPIQYMYFFISAEGVEGTDYVSTINIMPVMISDVSLFEFANDNDEYYLGIYTDDGYEWGTYGATEDDSANKIDNYLDVEDLYDKYIYYIGEDELDNVVNNKYTFNYSSNLSAKLYSTIGCEEENEIEVVDGKITLDVVNMFGTQFCVVYVKTPISDAPITVAFGFADDTTPTPEP